MDEKLSCGCSCAKVLARREFLKRLPMIPVGVQAAMWLAGEAGVMDAQSTWEPAKRPERGTGTKVRGAFLRIKAPYWMGWPGAAYDVEGHRKQFQGELEDAAKKLNIQLAFDNDYIYDDAGATDFLNRVKNEAPHGLLLIPLHMSMWKQIGTITDGASLPTIIFAPMGTAFTGHLKPYEGRKGTYLVSSVVTDEVVCGLRMLKTKQAMAESVIVNLRGAEEKEEKIAGLGTTIRTLVRDTYADEFNKTTDDAEMKAIADYYLANCVKVVEPTESDRMHAARHYVVARKFIEKHNADGITMDCLGLVGGRKIPCPPCQAWSMLNNELTPAACESDINAVLTYLLTMRLLGKPGFMQDPVPIVPTNVVIGAHCTSPTRLLGPEKPHVPFILRNHQESNLGVSMQVLWPEHEQITVTKFQGPNQLVVDTAFVLENVPTPPAGGCRTSVKVRMTALGNAQDWVGFHQCFVLGNHRRELRAFCQLFGIEAIRS